jgi:CheY-specific phosphatase CheX
MALFDDVLKGNIVTGLAIGIGAAILAPVVIPLFANIAKPLAKATIKGGIQLFEHGKEAFAEVAEITEDIVAEAKAELAESAAAAAVTVPPAAAAQGETSAS